jgi:hypothetical protein
VGDMVIARHEDSEIVVQMQDEEIEDIFNELHDEKVYKF